MFAMLSAEKENSDDCLAIEKTLVGQALNHETTLQIEMNIFKIILCLLILMSPLNVRSENHKYNISKKNKIITGILKNSSKTKEHTDFCPSLISGNLFSEKQLSNVRAVYRNGQTFITWKDVVEGEEGKYFRYSIHRASKPITQNNLLDSDCVIYGILNNSAKLFGHAFNQKDRLDSNNPTSVIKNEGKHLPLWSGLGVYSTQANEKAYYSVVATDIRTGRNTRTSLGLSSITEPVIEKKELIQAIKVFDSKNRGRPRGKITGTPNLPLMLRLHGYNAHGRSARAIGDYYLYFGDKSMGYRDGLPSVFSVHEQRKNNHNPQQLTIVTVDAIVSPTGEKAVPTRWFGYYSTPQNSIIDQPRVYPFTVNRLLWIVNWVANKYKVDMNRIYLSGTSMGGTGTAAIGFRNTDLFAAIYPIVPRFRKKNLPTLINKKNNGRVFLPDGKTDFFEHLDMVEYVKNHPSDLPFVGWSIGRNDGDHWEQQIEMVEALTEGRHGFAFAWNNGGHSQGSQPMKIIREFYSPDKFSLNTSYPAFSQSSLDDNLGNGQKSDGDLIGGINLGFDWDDIVDEKNIWSVTVANILAKVTMSVNITPRRIKNFKIKPGEKVNWECSGGGKGETIANRNGILTIGPISIHPKKRSKVIIKKAN